MTSATETAVANGDTRTLHLYHTHTGETIDATFRVDGHFDPVVLKQLNHFLRDWRNNDEIDMDPRLFDTLWEVYRTAGATDQIQIYSAYRSPETNAMLRRRSRAVAEHSQHMLGRAMDTTIPGFPMSRVREVGMRLQHGGVGWYPSANFVHLDVGSVRSWPRMPYDQLARLFPDGKTVHIASNGQVLPGYEAARAEIAAHGGTELPPAQESQGFFAWLFGNGTSGAAHEDEEDRASVVAAAPARPAARARPEAREAVAYAGRDAGAPATQPVEAAGSAREPAEPSPQRSEAAPSTDDTTGTLPLPPRRPTGLIAAAEIPLPPVRPTGLPAAQTGSVHYTVVPPRRPEAIAQAPGKAVRQAFLPPIITQGTRERLPGNVLAFAEAPASAQAVAKSAVTRPISARSIGLRAAQREVLGPGTVAGADTETPVVGGPQLTGLRKAHQILMKAAL